MTDLENELDSRYDDIAKRLKNIRAQIGYTLDFISQDAGIARSYLSEFERGTKYPNKTYLKYLYENHNVDLNYVIGGEGNPFRPPENERHLLNDFGKYSEDVKELLFYMINIPHALFYILASFAMYKSNYSEFIKSFNMLQKKEEASSPDKKNQIATNPKQSNKEDII